MRIGGKLTVAGLMMLALGGCVTTSQERTQAAQTELLGLERDDLLTCAGAPDREKITETGEFYTYETLQQELVSTPVFTTFGSGIGLGVRFRRSPFIASPLITRVRTNACAATFTLTDGAVSELTYSRTNPRAGRTFSSSACLSLVQTCLALHGTAATAPQASIVPAPAQDGS